MHELGSIQSLINVSEHSSIHSGLSGLCLNKRVEFEPRQSEFLHILFC